MANIATTPESADSNLTAQALREGFYAGLVSLGLFVLFVGLETTQNIRNELILNQRWGLLAIFVIVAAVGRFLTVAYLRPAMARRKAARAAVDVASVCRRRRDTNITFGGRDAFAGTSLYNVPFSRGRVSHHDGAIRCRSRKDRPILRSARSFPHGFPQFL